jgi:hypothetical protein
MKENPARMTLIPVFPQKKHDLSKNQINKVQILVLDSDIYDALREKWKD